MSKIIEKQIVVTMPNACKSLPVFDVKDTSSILVDFETAKNGYLCGIPQGDRAQVIYVTNRSTFPLLLINQSIQTPSINKFLLPERRDLVLSSNHTITLFYDNFGLGWRVLGSMPVPFTYLDLDQKFQMNDFSAHPDYTVSTSNATFAISANDRIDANSYKAPLRASFSGTASAFAMISQRKTTDYQIRLDGLHIMEYDIYPSYADTTTGILKLGLLRVGNESGAAARGIFLSHDNAEVNAKIKLTTGNGAVAAFTTLSDGLNNTTRSRVQFVVGLNSTAYEFFKVVLNGITIHESFNNPFTTPTLYDPSIYSTYTFSNCVRLETSSGTPFHQLKVNYMRHRLFGQASAI